MTPTCTVHKLIAGVVVLAGRKALLVKYKDTSSHDGQTGWFHPDDVLEDGEDPEAGASRILKEQLGLKPPKIRFGFFESFKGNDGTQHLMFHYKAKFAKPPGLAPSAKVAKAEWFDVRKLPPKAEFAHHGWARDVIGRLARNKK